MSEVKDEFEKAMVVTDLKSAYAGALWMAEKIADRLDLDRADEVRQFAKELSHE